MSMADETTTARPETLTRTVLGRFHDSSNQFKTLMGKCANVCSVNVDLELNKYAKIAL
jgi:hypothetical protein